MKLYQLCIIMRSRAIPILCLQEARDPVSGSRMVGNGYLFINSGADNGQRFFAGAGFLIAPWFRKTVYSFKPISERLCLLKLRTPGGKMKIINAYAPHNGHDYAFRQSFYADLGHALDAASSFGMEVVVGDLNARVHRSCPGEGDVFGEYCFGKSDYNPAIHTESNRALLLELCVANRMCVANTFVNEDVEHRVT